MSAGPDEDVPSPIDFHDPEQVRAWIENTNRKRPWRPRFFAAMAAVLNARVKPAARILELGSGPGALAAEILRSCRVETYLALDFSNAMHDVARAQLSAYRGKVQFVQRDFRAPDWADGLGLFDAALTLQAAHETRHKRYLVALLTQMRARLAKDGVLLYCDHYWEPGSANNPSLMPTREEQLRALDAAGFARAEPIHDEGGMALYAAVNASWEGVTDRK